MVSIGKAYSVITVANFHYLSCQHFLMQTNMTELLYKKDL